MDYSKLYLFGLLTFGYSLIVLLWAMTDPRSSKERFRDYFLSKHTLYYLGQLIVYGLIIVNIMYYPYLLMPDNYVLTIVGIASYLAGFVLLVWAKLTMKLVWGMPGQHSIKRQNRLVTNGPFALTRNPIYLGILFIGTGYFLSLRSYFIILLVPVFLRFYLATLKEEKLLEKYFGRKYLQYKRDVPRFL